VKIRGRHERDYFEAAVEVAPPALQAIAAVAVTFALTFAGHYFVPDWSVALTLTVGVITLVAASIWSWRARRLLLAFPRQGQRNARTKALSANSQWWLAGALASTFISRRDYSVPGNIRANAHSKLRITVRRTDPGTSPCVQSAQPVPDQGKPALRDPEGRPVGYVQLIRSVARATVWAG
jgi:hypothetical protein